MEATTIPTPADAEQTTAEQAAAKLEQLDKNVSQNGHTSAQATEARALAKAAGVESPKWAAKSTGRKSGSESKSGGPRRTKHGDEIAAADKRAKVLLGTEKEWGPAPIRHARVRKFVTKRLSGEVTTEGILEQAGVKSRPALKKLAKHGVARADLAPLRPLSKDLKGVASGAGLAAILYAWVEQVDKAEKESK